MAIVQISQITNRLGLQADLPQLSGGELGWSTDERRLYIGNGTLAQGAPVIGNTEILTEFSDILNLAAAYTYSGSAATGYTVQTGPTSGSPVVLSLQTWLDQYASVLDFGAVGDGVTDCTDAINRALYQLYCREINPAIRRSLFFPAGVYVVSGTINIPSYATLVGEGPENSIIQATPASNVQYVAQTADSLQQTGANIGTNGAVPPTDITISGMAFQNLASPSNGAIFLVNSANSCHATGVSFKGPDGFSPTTSALANYGVTFISTNSLPVQDISFDNCLFQSVTYGAGTNNLTNSITITASQFLDLYNGVIIGADSSTTSGFRITSNSFDNIYAQGIIFGANANLNASGYNIFYNVASSLAGGDGVNSTAAIIQIQGNNNASIGDMFARSAAFLNGYQWVAFDNTTSIATPNSAQLQMGTSTIESGAMVTLLGGKTDPLDPFTAFTLSTATSGAFVINYAIARGGYRTGTISIAAVGGTFNYTDDYTESENVGVALYISLAGSTITVSYNTTSGIDAVMNYTVSYFN